MSHLDAPLRFRRHSDPRSTDLHRRKTTDAAAHDAAISTARDALFDETYDSSAPSSPRLPHASLKTVPLPAQLELRRVFTRVKPASLAPAHPIVGPEHFSTDPSFGLHALVARQSAYSALADALGSITASTDCDAVAAGYPGNRAQLEAVCVRRRAAARSAEQAAKASSSSAAASVTSSRSATATSSSSRAVASSSRAVAPSLSRAAAASSSRAAASSRSATAAAAAVTRTPRAIARTTTRVANTPRVAAPLSTSLSPAQASSSALVVNSQLSGAASLVNSRAVASSASRAALQASVDSLFSVALSDVSSRRAAATASRTTSSSASSSSAIPPSSASSLPSSISSGADPSSTVQPARSNHNRIAKIVGPSVAIPFGLLLLALLAFCCLRRRRQRNGATGLSSGRSTPAIGPISHPQPMQAAPRQYGAMARYGPGVGAGAGAAGAAGAAVVGASNGNSSQESVGTTPSAIGVAFSEPRTKWGRRVPVDGLAGGVHSANSGSNTPTGSVGGSQDLHGARGVSASSSFGGRQASITSFASGSVPSEYRGVGGYNSFGYQPGQMRPVMTPVGGHYDQFGPSTAIIAVPAAAQRHHPLSFEEGSISGYGSGDDDEGPRMYGAGTAASDLSQSGSGSASGDSMTARLAPPLAAGYAHSPQAQQSRTTQATTSAGEEGYYTADAGPSSHDDHEAETLSDDGLREFGADGSPEAASVNFGSGSSGSGGHLSLAGSGRSFPRAGEDLSATPRLSSAPSTPRLGSGHGSLGNRRNDGTGSWWN
ncbi:hypothetical protein JCM3770_004667 [Rhodotorula araucariae]